MKNLLARYQLLHHKFFHCFFPCQDRTAEEKDLHTPISNSIFYQKKRLFKFYHGGIFATILIILNQISNALGQNLKNNKYSMSNTD